MSYNNTGTLSIFAPAKINLFIHVTGRLDNGYHTLDSLVSFVDIGDSIMLEPAPEFSFNIKGSYAASFVAGERDSSPDSSNIVVKAVWAYAREAQKEPGCRVTLTKNLPLASGMGGGSVDAAAVIWGLSELWDCSRMASYMPDLLMSLGADVPVCLECKPVRMQGVGEILLPSPAMSDIPVVLVCPGKFCSTKEVFASYAGQLSDIADTPEDLRDFPNLIDFLAEQENSLTDAAVGIVPDIALVLDMLRGQNNCRLARMSGSGSTCFGLFENEYCAMRAAENITRENPGWWVRTGTLNRPERY